MTAQRQWSSLRTLLFSHWTRQSALPQGSGLGGSLGFAGEVGGVGRRLVAYSRCSECSASIAWRSSSFIVPKPKGTRFRLRFFVSALRRFFTLLANDRIV